MKKVKEILWTIIVLTVIVFALVMMNKSCDRIGLWQKIAEGSLIIPKDSVDRWHELLSRPPDTIETITYRDTGSIIIIYKDPPEPEPDTDSTYTVLDSLVTDWFSVTHALGFKVNVDLDSIIRNKWSYRYWGPSEIVKTITQYVPKPVPYEVKVPASGFYLGAGTSVSPYAFSIGPGVSIIKDKWLYDVGLGRQYVFGTDNKSFLITGGIRYKF